MNTIMEEELDPRFKVLSKLLKIGGVPLTANVTLKYQIFRFVSIMAGYLMFLTTLMHSITNRDNVQVASESLRVAFPMFDINWMLTFTSLQNDRIMKMLVLTKEFTWESLPTRYPDTGSRTNASRVSLMLRVVPRFAILNMTVHCCNFVIRALIGTKYPLFFNAWLPIEANEFLRYIIILSIQIIASVNYIIFTYGLTGIYVTSVSLICSQLEKCMIILKEVKYEENESDHGLREKFREFVILHQKVLGFTNELQELTDKVFFGPFLTFVASLCFTLFNAVKNPINMADSLQIFSGMFFVLLQLYVLCEFGNELSIQSLKLRDAVWASQWVGTPVPFQKSIVIVLTSVKEISLSAGKIIPLSRHTMLQVVNNTYSFLMILLNSTDNSAGD